MIIPNIWENKNGNQTTNQNRIEGFSMPIDGCQPESENFFRISPANIVDICPFLRPFQVWIFLSKMLTEPPKI